MDESLEQQETALLQATLNIEGQVDRLRKTLNLGYTDYTPVFAMMIEQLTQALKVAETIREATRK